MIKLIIIFNCTVKNPISDNLCRYISPTCFQTVFGLLYRLDNDICLFGVFKPLDFISLDLKAFRASTRTP